MSNLAHDIDEDLEPEEVAIEEEDFDPEEGQRYADLVRRTSDVHMES